MNTKPKSITMRLITLFILFALPALACSTLVSDPESESSIAAGETTSGQGASSEDTAVQSDDPSEAPPSEGGEEDQAESSTDADAPADEPAEGDETAADAGGEDTSEETAGSGDSSESGEASEAGEAGDSGTSSGDSGSSSGDSGSATSSAGSPPSSDDPQAALTDALISGTQVDRMRINISGQQVEGLSNDMTLEVVQPDRFRLISPEIEMISVGDTLYMKASGSEWITVPAGSTSTFEPLLSSFGGGFSPLSSPEEAITGLEDVVFLGGESLNGLDTLVYEYTQADPGGQFSQTAKVWIGAADGRLYRQEVIGTFAGQAINSVLDFEYGPDIVIEPPI